MGVPKVSHLGTGTLISPEWFVLTRNRRDTMRQEIREDEAKSTPLSTALLAHADERNPSAERTEERAGERLAQHHSGAVVEERLPERFARNESNVPIGESGSMMRDADRPGIDGRPTKVQPGAARTGMQEQNQINAGKRPNEIGRTPDEEQGTPLFADGESKDLFAKWDALQVGFIDEPRRAVEQADHLVATAMKRTAEIFAEERARLEGQWDRGDNVSTEDLRVAMRRYRSFFRRLLAV
jgi:hypothetical protein